MRSWGKSKNKKNKKCKHLAIGSIMRNGRSLWSTKIMYTKMFNYTMDKVINNMCEKWNKGKNCNRNSKNYNRFTIS